GRCPLASARRGTSPAAPGGRTRRGGGRGRGRERGESSRASSEAAADTEHHPEAAGAADGPPAGGQVHGVVAGLVPAGFELEGPAVQVDRLAQREAEERSAAAELEHGLGGGVGDEAVSEAFAERRVELEVAAGRAEIGEEVAAAGEVQRGPGPLVQERHEVAAGVESEDP